MNSHFLTDELLQNIGLSSEDTIKNNEWIFGQSLKNLSSKQLSTAILDTPYLQTKYHVLCATLVKNAKKYSQNQQKNHVISILIMAQLLEHIHLQSTQLELQSLQRTQAFCHNYLQKIGIEMPELKTKPKHQYIIAPYEEAIRSTTTQLDFWRLIILRGRRVLFWSIPLVNNTEYYGRFISPLEGFLRIVIFYQACLLVPRFITNLFHLLKHWWSPSENEQSLSALERHQAHLNMNARWWEIAYDFGWITLGLLNAFVLIGSWAPFAIYAAVVLPSYNLFLHTTRLFIEDGRLKKMEADYQSQLEKSPLKADEINTFLEQLKERRSYNQNLLLLRMSVCICIVSTGIFGIWTLIPPIVPFIAAVLSVLVTIAGKLIPAYLPKQKDQLQALELDDSPSPLLRNTLFSNKKDDTQSEIPAEANTLVHTRQAMSLTT
ncbi:MAG: hypothetical protein P1U61_00105 [Legionellaceae bacterium]|nr:hypothetical protein [Legionellaceae bacterium]